MARLLLVSRQGFYYPTFSEGKQMLNNASKLAALLLVFSTPALAVDFDLGNLSVPGVRAFGNTLSSEGDGSATYTDNYSFAIGESAQSGSLVAGLDFFNPLDIVINSVAIAGVGSFAGGGFLNFGVIGAGSYTLTVVSTVTGVARGGISYGGLLTLRSAGATSVPEPGTLAIYAFGLLAVAYVTRRKVVRAESA